MDNFNENVFRQGHYEDWNNKLGKNFTNNVGIHNELMIQKNIETGGGYQATVSGMYGEFTIAAVLKSLPEEYVVLNDILIQTGVQIRKYSLLEHQKYGETPWDLAIKIGKNKFKPVNKQIAINDMITNNKSYYEVVKKSSQIDHLIVSPYGIFVIETKNHKGWVYGSDSESTVWTQVLNGENGRRAYGGHAHYTFLNPVTQNELHMQHLSKNLNIGKQFMAGMIVFTNPEAYLDNVNCNCCYTLDMFTEALLSYNRQIWTEKQRDKIIEAVEKMNSNSYKLNKEHLTYVKDIQHRSEINRIYGGGRRFKYIQK